MQEKPKRHFPVSIVVLVVIATLFGFGTGWIIISSRSTQDNPVIILPTSSLRELGVDNPAPDFTLNTLSGQPVALKDLRGKPVLINFWASWCPPCLTETPDLVDAYNTLRDSGVVFVGIGTQDETDKLKKFVDEHSVPYIVVEDPKGKVNDLYGVLGLPTTVLVDSQGIVRKVFTGPVNKEKVIEEIKRLG